MLSIEYYSTSVNMGVQVSGLLILFLLDLYAEVGKPASYGISTFGVFEKSPYSSNAALTFPPLLYQSSSVSTSSAAFANCLDNS